MEDNEAIKNIIKALNNQMLAAMSVLNQCINNCPDDEWNESHKDYPFCRVLWHVQHHAAQLGLRVQQITGKELEWINN